MRSYLWGSASSGRTIYEADCKNRPNYHDGKPRKRWEQLGKVEQMSWGRPAAILKEGDDMGGLQPNLQHLSDDDEWKDSSVTNGKMTKFLVGRYRVILPNSRITQHAAFVLQKQHAV
jgi:hypothetical protein